MKEIVSTITGKGQVTIPREVRQRLGVVPSDKVVFVVDDSGTVELRPVRHTVASLRGIVPARPGLEPTDFDAEIAAAMESGISDIVQEPNSR